MIKLTPVQERIVKQVAQYQAETGQWPSVVEVSASEKKEAEHFLGGSFIEVKIKREGNKNVSTV